MADKKSLSDLGALTGAEPEKPVVEASENEGAAAETPAADAPADEHGTSTQGPQIEAILREQQLDKQGRAYATGRRKDAVARAQ